MGFRDSKKKCKMNGFEVNKILKDSKIQLWNSRSALSASRNGTSTQDRDKFTLHDQLNLEGQIATNGTVKNVLRSDVYSQCFDTSHVMKVMGKILKEEKSYLSTRDEIEKFKPRFQNFMDSLNYL